MKGFHCIVQFLNLVILNFKVFVGRNTILPCTLQAVLVELVDVDTESLGGILCGFPGGVF